MVCLQAYQRTKIFLHPDDLCDRAKEFIASGGHGVFAVSDKLPMYNYPNPYADAEESLLVDSDVEEPRMPKRSLFEDSQAPAMPFATAVAMHTVCMGSGRLPVPASQAGIELFDEEDDVILTTLASDLERRRAANIAANDAKLAEMNIGPLHPEKVSGKR